MNCFALRNDESPVIGSRRRSNPEIFAVGDIYQ